MSGRMGWTAGLMLLATAGCGLAHGLPDAPDAEGEPDAGAPSADAAPAAADAGPACDIPTADFGTRIGAHFSPLTLEECGPAGAYSFYGADYCDVDVTVLMVNAGWCHPSNVAAQRLGPEIVDVYGPRVRVLEVLVQNDSFGPADETFCAQWTARNSVRNVELLDPTGLTQIYYPSDMIPSTVVVDAHGRIRERLYGITTDPLTGSGSLSDITHAIDAVLADPDGTAPH